MEIGAPPKAVWELISNFEGWARWNPLYPKARAVAGIGDTVAATIVIPGMKPSDFSAEIDDWVPGSRLGWHTSNLGGLTRMTRYMVIEPAPDGSSLFIHGEVFGGLLGSLVGRMLRSRVEAGYRAMSVALKQAAEAA